MQIDKRRHQRRQRDLLRAVENRRLDVLALLEVIVDVLDGHRRIVDQDADRQRKAAQRHDVDGLAEAPTRQAIEARIDSGIDSEMISVLRQLPRNSRIISPVSAAAITASRTTPVDRRAHEQRLIADRLDLQRRRAGSRESAAASP